MSAATADAAATEATPRRAPRPIPPALEKLAQLYPQLFGAVFLPLKRGIFQDLLAAHPEAFEREALVNPVVAVYPNNRDCRVYDGCAAERSLVAAATQGASMAFRGGLQPRQQQTLIQLFAQPLGLFKPHACEVFGEGLCRRCVQRGFAQFIDLREFEFALEPVQCPQQVLLLGTEIAAQRVLRE